MRDMSRICFICKESKECCWSDKLHDYCCGDCWEDDMTRRSAAWNFSSVKLSPRGVKDSDEEASPWQAVAVRQLEDG
jgi:hypothetical protein